ncbi:hypothetical protein [Brevibacterium sp.]|uniref:hypothetical protein n=1 Tax=Brevibacterium sp. TaxID=1701 RepID=UPI0025C2C976|nr:hypothetical protein [Brevibacterium sp.]
MTEDTVPSLLRALRDTEVDPAEEIRLDAESSIVTGREAGGSVRELWFEADSAPRVSEAAGHRRSSGAHLDLESLEHFSLEDVVAQAREYEPGAGLGISSVRIYGGTGDVETHGEFGSLVDVSFEGSYSAVTMRLDDLERLD